MPTEGEKCNCSWDECSSLQEQIASHLPEDHVWQGKCHRWTEIRLTKNNTFERMLFLAAMCRHVPGIAEAFKDGRKSKNRKQIVLARHHFPVAVYTYLNRRKCKVTALLKEFQMEILQETNPYPRLAEDCNRVGKMATFLKRKIHLQGKLLDNYISRENACLNSKANFFVCAPIATRQEVIDTVHALSHKMKERQPPPVQERSSPVDEPYLLLSGASVSTSKMSVLLQAADSLTTGPEPIVNIPEPSPVLVPSAEDCSKESNQHILEIDNDR